MFILRHKLKMLNIFLATATCTSGWHLHHVWLRNQRRSSALLEYRPNVAVPLEETPTPLPTPLDPANYSDIVQKNLFSKDRIPNVFIEPLAVESKPKWPSLPILYGVLGLPESIVALLSEKSGGRPRVIRIGERIGGLKLVALSADSISFEFDGETRKVDVRALLDRGYYDKTAQAEPSQKFVGGAAQRIGP
jgi:hypothetical protein